MTRKDQQIGLISSGIDFFDTLSEMIDATQQYIYLNFYIFSDDETGDRILSKLIDKANASVDVYLVLDGYASTAGKTMINKLSSAGIHFYQHAPLFRFKEHSGRRMHEKLVLADGKYLLIGGINISDKYNTTKKGTAWLDFAVLMKGDITTDALKHLNKYWNHHIIKPDLNIQHSSFIKLDNRLRYLVDASIRSNDWLFHQNEITSTYIRMIKHAKDNITILCSYFIPGAVIRRLLANASKRGVKIRIVTTGVSDVYLAKSAEKWLYDWLLRNNMEIYEYQKNVLHGKLAIADGMTMTIGSYNINNISTYASMEMNVEVIGKEFCRNCESQINNIINNDCVHITREIHAKQKNYFIQLIRWISYQFIRIVLTMFTWPLQRRKRTKYSKKIISDIDLIPSRDPASLDH